MGKFRQAMTIHYPGFCIHEKEAKADNASASPRRRRHKQCTDHALILYLHPESRADRHTGTQEKTTTLLKPYSDSIYIVHFCYREIMNQIYIYHMHDKKIIL